MSRPSDFQDYFHYGLGAAGPGGLPSFLARSGARSMWVALRQARSFSRFRLYLLCMIAFRYRIVFLDCSS